MFECVLNVPLEQTITNLLHIFKHTSTSFFPSHMQDLFVDWCYFASHIYHTPKFCIPLSSQCRYLHSGSSPSRLTAQSALGILNNRFLLAKIKAYGLQPTALKIMRNYQKSIMYILRVLIHQEYHRKLVSQKLGRSKCKKCRYMYVGNNSQNDN